MEGWMMTSVQIWLAIGIVLIIAELTTMSFFLLWPGIAALIVALLTWLMPSLGIVAQLVIFSLISVALLIPGRRMIMPMFKKDAAQNINSRMQSLIGSQATVVAVNGSSLRAKHGDTEWSAKSELPLKKGNNAVIIATDGNVLVLGEIDG